MRFRLVLFMAFSVVITPIQATAMMSEAGMVYAISAGALWANGGETQTFFLAPEIEKTYAARKSSNALAWGEVFAGMQTSLSPMWLGQLGISAAITGNAALQGEIWDDADPQFNNYSYAYRVSHRRLAIKGKLLLDKEYWLLPWVSASLGIGFNNTHDFTNTPLICEAVINPNFINNTTTALTYTLGFGLQRALTEQVQVGLGYEFADWGKSELGQALGQTLNTGLKLNHLYTNGLLLNLTYLA